jgi:hypothetical protein
MRAKVTLLASAALVVIGMLPIPSAGADTNNGVFSVRCPFSHRAPDDPIVHPNIAGGAHSHDFFGNRSTNAASTFESMMQAQTSCELPEDTSAYWVPTLLSPSGSPARVNWAFAYYRNLPSRGGPPTAFPPDFRMIAGFPTVPTGTDKVLGWNCQDSDPYLATPPDCGGRNLKLHLVFPSCWDGVNLDSPDHRSHMSYPVAGRCPETHPVKLLRMSLHVTYGVTDGRGYQLASDAEKGVSDGRSAHGDFWNTWDQPALEHLVEECLQPGTSCPRVRSVPVDSGGDEETSTPGGEAGRCLGMPVTDRGTQGSDHVIGSSAAEIVSTLEGQDVVRSRSGGDRVCAGRGDDTARGGWGRDRLRGGGGSDLLTGGPGRDVLLGGPGRDRCIGGPGRDIAKGCEVRRRI